MSLLRRGANWKGIEAHIRKVASVREAMPEETEALKKPTRPSSYDHRDHDLHSRQERENSLNFPTPEPRSVQEEENSIPLKSESEESKKELGSTDVQSLSRGRRVIRRRSLL